MIGVVDVINVVYIISVIHPIDMVHRIDTIDTTHLRFDNPTDWKDPNGYEER